ncbi:protein YffM, partial [Klebsiella pneumoniae]|nr:protein YffM [Klebsiella pneumoniae]
LYDCSEEEKLFVKRLKLIKADIHAQLKACDCDISE